MKIHIEKRLDELSIGPVKVTEDTEVKISGTITITHIEASRVLVWAFYTEQASKNGKDNLLLEITTPGTYPFSTVLSCLGNSEWDFVVTSAEGSLWKLDLDY